MIAFTYFISVLTKWTNGPKIKAFALDFFKNVKPKYNQNKML